MRASGTILLAAALAAVSVPAAAATAPERLLFTGSDGSLWLVSFQGRGESFDLAGRVPNGNWKWVDKGLTGRPAAAVASGSEIHLLFTHPSAGYLIFRAGTPSPTAQLNPQNPDWPEGVAPLAMCQAVDFAAVRGSSILAVVPRLAGTGTTQPTAAEPARQPTSRTTSGPAPAQEPSAPPPVRPARRADPPQRVDLGIFQNVRGNWVRMADVKDVPHPPANRAFVAAYRGAIQLILPEETGQGFRLLEHKAGQWQPLPLPDRLGSDRALALMEIRDRLVLVAAAASDGPANRKVLLATLRGPGGQPTVRPITRDAKPVTWAAAELPLVARLADQLALLWRKGADLESTTCDPLTATMFPASPVNVFEQPAVDNRGAQFVEYFTWAIVIAIFLPMFLMRPKSPMAFALPEDLRPAPLGRRLLAGLIDFLPFYFLAHVALLLSLPTMDKREILDFAEQVFNRQRLPLQVAVVVLGMLVGYAGYCTIFEMLFGATIGKRIMKMRVVGFDGGPASFRGCLLRNLVKIIEMIWLLPIPILFLIPLLNRNRQRLGDMLARTVVADASQRSTAQPPPPPTPPGSGEDPSGRGDPPDPPA